MWKIKATEPDIAVAQCDISDPSSANSASTKPTKGAKK